VLARTRYVSSGHSVADALDLELHSRLPDAQRVEQRARAAAETLAHASRDKDLGGISDLEVVEQSGVLDFLQEGDAILADRDFQMWGVCQPLGLSLIMPTVSHRSASNCMQSAPFTAEERRRFTYDVAHVRIHVE